MEQAWELKLLVNRLGFLRAEEKDLVAGRLDTKADWMKLTPADLEVWLGRRLRARWDAADLLKRLGDDLRFLERPGTFVLEKGRWGFPADLEEIADPPWLLWGRGEFPDRLRPWVAVVGTRYPTERAKTAAFRLARELTEGGAVVVSGLARGIDALAHAGSVQGLSDWGGTTVAVLGNGIDTVSPPSNRRLAARILAAGGAIVSEYGPGEPAFGYRFVARNRLISGLCRTLVVVEAPQKSGALITADFALDQGRDVVVHADGLDGERGAGTLELSRQGAPVIAGTNDLMRLWNGEDEGFKGFEQ